MRDREGGMVGEALRCNAIPGSDFTLLLGVDFGKGDFGGAGELCGELFVDRSDLLAGAAPVCVN